MAKAADLFIQTQLSWNLRDLFFCEEIVKVCDTDYYKPLKIEDFTDRVLSDKPKELENDDFIQNLYKDIAKDKKKRRTIKIAHVADAHVDLDYAVGYAGECNGIICCREKFGKPEDPSLQAGEWGSYMCDLPYKTAESAMQFIRDEIEPDALIWTGDITPHDGYNLDEQQAETYADVITKLFKENFEEKLPIFPVQGNHDFGHLNSQDFNSPDPMISYSANLWKDFLEPEAYA